MRNRIGRLRWVIPEGYIPPSCHGHAPEFTSHEAFCVLNTNREDAHLAVTVFYADCDPVGPYQLTVPARRTRHFRFNNLDNPAPIALGDFLFKSNRVECPGCCATHAARFAAE